MTRKTPGGPSGPSGPSQTDAQRRERGAIPLRGVTLPPEIAAELRSLLGPEPWEKGTLSHAIQEAAQEYSRVKSAMEMKPIDPNKAGSLRPPWAGDLSEEQLDEAESLFSWLNTRIGRSTPRPSSIFICTKVGTNRSMWYDPILKQLELAFRSHKPSTIPGWDPKFTVAGDNEAPENPRAFRVDLRFELGLR